MEIWGGVECTVARVRNRVHDQLKLNGHEKRLNDLDLFADLGIRTIRYPILWEKYCKNPKAFFSLHDKRLEKLRAFNITPIAGLVHHGSGPFTTDLSQQSFSTLLAEFAYIIAEHYPWIEYYNPVNEPLTTARFSGLYGIWYPHYRSDSSFARIFINEMKGVVLSMKNVRIINPNAKLIPTEDICKVHSTPALKSQAEFENNRRWLTYDLLTGKLKHGHPLWNYFLAQGIAEQELEFFTENICQPYICGYNYYVTSERYLDEKKYRYPRRYHGGNGKIEYADVEAVRVGAVEPSGFYDLLKESWNRYKLPLALTEVHLGCTREEQLRWFNEAYTSAIRLKNDGVDFRAITAWSLLGSYDWNSLLKNHTNIYESGVFDLRSGNPRTTALAQLIKNINSGEALKHPLLEIPGWWKRDIRMLYDIPKEKKRPVELNNNNEISPLLIVGANGSLGKAFARICAHRGIVYQLLNREQFDIASMASMEKFLSNIKPWAIINAAGYTNIDKAESCPQQCFRENTLGAVLLSQVCKSANIKFVTFSTDQVFNGKKKNPYVENDLTEPLNRYGESKKMAEEFVLKNNPEALIIRSSFFFNPWSNDDLLGMILQTENPKQFYLASDIIISPTYIPDLVQHVLDLLIDNESGIWHLSGPDEMSHFSFIQLALNIADKSNKHVFSRPFEKLNYTADRPSYSVLMSSQGIVLPSIHVSLNNYINELKATSYLT